MENIFPHLNFPRKKNILNKFGISQQLFVKRVGSSNISIIWTTYKMTTCRCIRLYILTEKIWREYRGWAVMFIKLQEPKLGAPDFKNWKGLHWVSCTFLFQLGVCPNGLVSYLTVTSLSAAETVTTAKLREVIWNMNMVTNVISIRMTSVTMV